MLYLSEKDAAAIESGKAPRRHAKDVRPGLPRAPRAEATGLTAFLLAGWSVTYAPAYGYRLVSFDGQLDTGWRASEKAACDRAKALRTQEGL